MLKFILHWWNSSEKSEGNKEFFNEVFGDIWNERVLYIPFAQYKEKWNISVFYEKNKEHIGDRKFNLILASRCKLKLIYQIIISDIIYIPGWNYKSLHSKLSFLKYLRFIFNDKIIIWISAWTNLFSRYSYSQDYDTVFEWLWFLNIKTICHYDEEKYCNAVSRLDEYWEKFDIVKLKEMEFVCKKS